MSIRILSLEIALRYNLVRDQWHYLQSPLIMWRIVKIRLYLLKYTASRCALFSGKIHLVGFAFSRRRRGCIWWHERCLTQGDNSFMNNYGTGTASSRRRFLLGTTFSTRQEIWMRGPLRSYSLWNVQPHEECDPLSARTSFFSRNHDFHVNVFYLYLRGFFYFYLYSLPENIITLWRTIPKIL